jgi:hypothetical protein
MKMATWNMKKMFESYAKIKELRGKHDGGFSWEFAYDFPTEDARQEFCSWLSANGCEEFALNDAHGADHPSVSARTPSVKYRF